MGWFLRLREGYKKDWSAFVSAFKKLFSPLHFMFKLKVELHQKKETETVRQYAVRVRKIVKKGWCNASAAPISLKCNETVSRI